MVTAGLISYDVEAIRSLVAGEDKSENSEQVLGLTQYFDGLWGISVTKMPNQ